MAPTARMATSGGFRIDVKCSMPYMPRLEIVKALPSISWALFSLLSHGCQIIPFPHELIRFKERLGHDEIAQLLDGAVDMFLAAAQNENTMAGQEEIDPKFRQLLNVRPIIRKVTSLGIDESHFASVKNHV